MRKRIYRQNVNLDETAISHFFESRAEKYNEVYPYVAVNYQDSNPKLTFERDEAEKKKITPLLKLNRTSTVLDVGCGIGRWADSLHELVGYYHGTDFSKKLINIAQKRFSEQQHVNFQSLRAQDTNSTNLKVVKKFDTVIVSGLLIYLNDEGVLQVFNNLTELASDNALIYIREPVATHERLTLNKMYSEELTSEYSAIYRTRDEIFALLKVTLLESGFSVLEEGALLPKQLSNRKETEQHYIILERRI